MWQRRDAFALSLIVIACRRDAPAPPAPAPAPEEASAPPIVDASIERFTDVDDIYEYAQDEIQRMIGIEPEHVAKVKSIGHTSVVLKLEMREGAKYAFKPRTKKGFSRYKGEIAAFRLAILLDIADHVPKAYPETFRRDELSTGADEGTLKLIADEVVFEGDATQGAKMPWIDDYAVLSLERDQEWRAWLKKGAAIPDDKKERAREISTMILFDYVTGNWDRWSGGNVATSKGKVLYVDNDGAFFETPPKDGLARNKRYLEGVDRFSKSFVEKLRALDRDKVQTLRAYVTEKALAGVFARRDEALAVVDKKELFFR